MATCKATLSLQISALALCLLSAFACIRAAPLTITGSGATTVQALFQNLTTTVSQPNQKIIYKALGSGEGRREFIYSVVHFAASDVPFSSQEESQLAGYVHYTLPLLLETISFFTVIPKKPSLRLSNDVLAGIFQRQITTWDDPAILKLNPSFKPPKGQKINVVVRKDKSGSTQLVTNFLALTSPSKWKLGVSGLPKWPAGVRKGNGTSKVISKLKAFGWSIGYAGTSTGLAKGLTEVQVKNPANKWVTASKADLYASVPTELPPSTGSWSSVSLLLNTGPQTWPITSFVYLFARQNQVQNGDQGALVSAWLKFLFSQSTQSLLTSFNLSPLPQRVLKKNLAAMKSMILSPMAKSIVLK